MKKILLFTFFCLGTVFVANAMEDGEKREVVIPIDEIELSLGVEEIIEKSDFLNTGMDNVLQKLSINPERYRSKFLNELEKNGEIEKKIKSELKDLGVSKKTGLSKIPFSTINYFVSKLQEYNVASDEKKNKAEQKLQKSEGDLIKIREIILSKDELLKEKEKKIEEENKKAKNQGLLAKLGLSSGFVSTIIVGAITVGSQWFMSSIFQSSGVPGNCTCTTT